MKSISILFIIVFGAITIAYAQKPSIELSFTAVDNTTHLMMDSILIINQSQGEETVLYYPDSILVLTYEVGVSEFDDAEEGLILSQNYPNPVEDETTISFFIPRGDRVHILVSDILGRTQISREIELDKGRHSFNFHPGIAEMYIFTVFWNGISRSVKILNNNTHSNYVCTLEYGEMKAGISPLNQLKSKPNLAFSLGDELLYIGYAGDMQSGLLDAPQASNDYTFQFASNIACPGLPTIEYEGQIYNTIQIYSQCWLKENLNVGEKITGENSMSNNGIIEKYCYSNSLDSCAKYGGLYTWQEMMQYVTIEGTQGICPPGWHIPTDEEWKVLEGSVDTYNKIGHNIWNAFQSRGVDAGFKLKNTEGWLNNGNGSNASGFTALPGGDRGPEGLFYLIGDNGYWWTSSRIDSEEVYRKLTYQSYVTRLPTFLELGLSVRCLKDN